MAGRPSRQRALDAWINGHRVGRWGVSAQGVHTFAYDAAWSASPQARPLSLSLPLEAGKHRGERVQAYFDHLLPTAAVPRQRLQAGFGTASAQSFDLLTAVGRDCAGAVQLLVADATPGDPMRVEGEPLAERDLVRLLDTCAAPPGAIVGADAKLPRVALAGSQAKTALLRHAGRWWLPAGATPSTHILKLPLGAMPGGQPALSTSLENEWLCTRLLREFGFAVAPLRLETIGPHKVLVAERIDRRWVDDRWWARLPMEDFCQATATPVQRAPESAGGPGLARMLDLLRGSDEAAHDRERLLAATVVMWMLAVPEVSGKRFALWLRAGGHFVLAPLAGVMSAWPLLGRTPAPASLKRLPWTLSPLGEALAHHQVTLQDWHRAARRHALGIRFEAVLAGLVAWAQPAIDAVAADMPSGFPHSVSDSVFEGLRRSARALSP